VCGVRIGVGHPRLFHKIGLTCQVHAPEHASARGANRGATRGFTRSPSRACGSRYSSARPRGTRSGGRPYVPLASGEAPAPSAAAGRLGRGPRNAHPGGGRGRRGFTGERRGGQDMNGIHAAFTGRIEGRRGAHPPRRQTLGILPRRGGRQGCWGDPPRSSPRRWPAPGASAARPPAGGWCPEAVGPGCTMAASEGVTPASRFARTSRTKLTNPAPHGAREAPGSTRSPSRSVCAAVLSSDALRADLGVRARGPSFRSVWPYRYRFRRRIDRNPIAHPSRRCRFARPADPGLFLPSGHVSRTSEQLVFAAIAVQLIATRTTANDVVAAEAEDRVRFRPGHG
jgi:hypothetical protein